MTRLKNNIRWPLPTGTQIDQPGSRTSRLSVCLTWTGHLFLVSHTFFQVRRCSIVSMWHMSYTQWRRQLSHSRAQTHSHRHINVALHCLAAHTLTSLPYWMWYCNRCPIHKQSCAAWGCTHQILRDYLLNLLLHPHF